MSADLRVVGGTAAAKVVVLGVSGLLGIVTSRIILSDYGVAAYAQYGLLATLPALLPFADLGIAAVVVNAVAGSEHPDRDPHVRAALTSALRVLMLSAAVIATAAVLVGAMGWWPVLLGEGLLPGSGRVATLCLVVFAATLPLTLGARVLVGLHRNTQQVAAQATIAPTILVTLVVLTALGVPMTRWLALVSYGAAVVSALVCLRLAWRAIGPQLAGAVRSVPDRRGEPGVRVLEVAWPMLVQMLALPFAMQTGRVLVSHTEGVRALAEYNLALQLFSLALQTVSAAGIALWPIYARARSTGDVRSPFPVAVVFGAGGLLIGGVLALVSPWLVDLIADGRLRLGWGLLAAFTAFVVVAAVKYPLGMYMTDKVGLRHQVIPTVLMVPVSIGLGLGLLDLLGTASLVVGMTTAVLVCQILPMAVYVARDLRRRREL